MTPDDLEWLERKANRAAYEASWFETPSAALLSDDFDATSVVSGKWRAKEARLRRIIAALTAQQEMHRAAWSLSAWAASIKWNARERNTEGWLAGLRSRIESVQAFGTPRRSASIQRLHAERGSSHSASSWRLTARDAVSQR